MRVLRRGFFARDTVQVAQDLVGKLLVRGSSVARLVETEAYHGSDDQASHARRGPTPRAAIMFGPPGHAYVYLIYGMYWCLNLVTMKKGFPGAVLLRAAAPVPDHPFPSNDPRAAAGPGKLCRAFAIDRAVNGADIARRGPLYFADDGFVARTVAGPRIGIDYAGEEWASRPWRFWLAGDPAVSRK